MITESPHIIQLPIRHFELISQPNTNTNSTHHKSTAHGIVIQNGTNPTIQPTQRQTNMPSPLHSHHTAPLRRIVLPLLLVLLVGLPAPPVQPYIAQNSRFICFVDCVSAFAFTDWTECYAACRFRMDYEKDLRQKSWNNRRVYVRPVHD